MSVPEQNVEFVWKPNPSLEDARKWIGGSERKEVISRTIKFPSFDDYPPQATIKKVVQHLKEKKDMASALLELCGFTRGDSVKIVETLIADVGFYAEDHWPFYDEQEFYPLDVTFECLDCSIDISIIGRILGPLLSRGCHIEFLRTDEGSSHFWIYLSGILLDCGVPVRMTPFEPDVEIPRLICGRLFDKTKISLNTPVIVFENSDIFAAVRTIVQSAWEFNGETYWAPTHVFVQESQYDVFVSLLKMDSIHHLELWGIKVTQKEATATEGQLPILQPCDSSHFKFFLGWDPKALHPDEDVGSGVAVVPFRTVDEGISAANSLPNTFCSSLWTEKSKFGSQVAAKLKMNTVWINCHGVLDPLTSFASDSDLVPFNGPYLFEILLACSRRKTLFPFSPFPDSLPDLGGVDIESPHLLKDSERISKLRPLKELIKSRGLNLGIGVRWSDYSYRVTESGMEITSHYLAGLPQYFKFCDHADHVVNDDFLLVLVYNLFLRGQPLMLIPPKTQTVSRLCQILFKASSSRGHQNVERRDTVVPCRYGRSGLSFCDGITFRNDNYDLIPHFSHVLTHTKNVFII